MDGIYWEAISILEREVHERSEGGTRPLQCRDAMVLLGVNLRVNGVGQA